MSGGLNLLWPNSPLFLIDEKAKPFDPSSVGACMGEGPGFKTYWRWKSCGRAARPRIERELREVTRRMNRENPLWGAPRIHGELLKLGFAVAESTVSKYVIRRRLPPSQSWRTFLRNHAQPIAAIDLCVVPTLSFERLLLLLSWATDGGSYYGLR